MNKVKQKKMFFNNNIYVFEISQNIYCNLYPMMYSIKYDYYMTIIQCICILKSQIIK